MSEILKYPCGQIAIMMQDRKGKLTALSNIELPEHETPTTIEKEKLSKDELLKVIEIYQNIF